MFSSPKTTIAGIMVAIAAIISNVSFLIDADPMTNIDWSIIAAEVAVIYGLITARDNDVTSEETGAQEAAAMRALKR